ncbi:MAG TPA: hypothetical protein VF875_05445 [Anaeromyxobacter sp.]
MIRAAPILLAVLTAAPVLAQGGLEPSGRLPPITPSPSSSPKNATPVQVPAAPPARGTVLEQVTGTVKEVDRKEHRIVVDAGGATITLSLDRNTMVYTAAGLGTVLDVVPGAQIRAGRNAEMVAYWVQVRPAAPPAGTTPVPGQGTGPGGGSAAPATEPRGGGVAGPQGGTSSTPSSPGVPR